MFFNRNLFKRQACAISVAAIVAVIGGFAQQAILPGHADGLGSGFAAGGGALMMLLYLSIAFR